MNELMIFEGHEVEAFEMKGQALFNPYHVAECLDIADVKSSIRNFNEKQIVKVKNSDVHSMHFRKLNNAGENFLTESGVYKLVFKSRKPNAEKFTDWVTDEVLPTLRKTGSYKMSNPDNSIQDRTEIMMMNARSRMAQTYLKLAQVDTLSTTYKSVLVAKGAEVLAGEAIVPLPKVERKTYSAEEIGNILGISANMVGRLANKNNLKKDNFGCYYHDKKKHSEGQCETWRYFDTVISEFKRILGIEVA